MSVRAPQLLAYLLGVVDEVPTLVGAPPPPRCVCRCAGHLVTLCCAPGQAIAESALRSLAGCSIHFHYSRLRSCLVLILVFDDAEFFCWYKRECGAGMVYGAHADP